PSPASAPGRSRTSPFRPSPSTFARSSARALGASLPLLATQVTGGLVVTPDGVRPLDVVVEGERIRELVPPGRRTRRTIDATGCYVLPGGVDPHTHVFADVGSSTSAAALDGTTTVIPFTLPEPGRAPVQALVR